jgi:choline dehydrogenase-like flavoprotein
MAAEKTDVVIVGAGAAGAAIASRYMKNPGPLA